MRMHWGHKMELDKRELLLLSFFRRNARLALTKISKETVHFGKYQLLLEH